jgi:hypothetical protein
VQFVENNGGDKILSKVVGFEEMRFLNDQQNGQLFSCVWSNQVQPAPSYPESRETGLHPLRFLGQDSVFSMRKAISLFREDVRMMHTLSKEIHYRN